MHSSRYPCSTEIRVTARHHGGSHRSGRRRFHSLLYPGVVAIVVDIVRGLARRVHILVAVGGRGCVGVDVFVAIVAGDVLSSGVHIGVGGVYRGCVHIGVGTGRHIVVVEGLLTGIDVAIGVVRRRSIDVGVGIVARGRGSRGVRVCVRVGVDRGAVYRGVVDVVVGVVVGVGARDSRCGRGIIVGVHQGL